MLEPGADPVRKVSIVPRGRALGVTFQSPDDRPLRLRRGATCEGRIVGALGGRAAEEIVYGNVTTGAESDLEQVTRIARQMVGRWGMSDKIGLVSVLPGPGDEVAPFPARRRRASERRASWSTHEVRRIVDECYEARRQPCCARTATSSSALAGACSRRRRSTRPTPIASPASSDRRAAPRSASGPRTPRPSAWRAEEPSE